MSHSYKAFVLEHYPGATITKYEWSWTVFSAVAGALGSGRSAMAAWKDAAANVTYKKGAQQRGEDGGR